MIAFLWLLAFAAERRRALRFSAFRARNPRGRARILRARQANPTRGGKSCSDLIVKQ